MMDQSNNFILVTNHEDRNPLNVENPSEASFLEGATFTPKITFPSPTKIRFEWSNNRGLPNPEPMEFDIPMGNGDMVKAIYDTNGDGIVDKAENSTNAENALTVNNFEVLRNVLDNEYTNEQIDEIISNLPKATGDMEKSVYDIDNDGIVDNSKMLDGHSYEDILELFAPQLVNHQGTSIHATNTVASNLVQKRGIIEVHGETIQNCLDHSNANKFDLFSGTIDENGYINITTDGDRKYFYNKKESLVVKPNTQYTFIIEVLENTTTAGGIAFGGSGVTCFFSIIKDIPYSDFKGTIKFTAFTNDEFDSVTSGIGNTVRPGTTGGTLKFRYAIVEGDWTQKEISFVPFGLNYPKTTEIVECGKNLFNGNDEINTVPDKGNIDNGYNIYENNVLKAYSNVYSVFPRGVLLKNLKGKTISVSAHVDKMGSAIRAGLYIYENYEMSPAIYDLGTDAGDLKINAYEVKSDVLFVCFGGTVVDSSSKLSNPVEYSNIQIEIGSTVTEYEPYTERKVNINYPLTSIDETIRDSYYVKDGKKYHEQVIKEVVFDGSDDEAWAFDSDNNYYYIGVSDLKHYSKLLCDKAYYIDSHPDKFGQCYVTAVIVLGCDRSVYPTPQDFKNYLKTNPYTFLYELKEPITTEIQTEDWYSFDEQTNIWSSNTVKVPLNIDIFKKASEVDTGPNNMQKSQYDANNNGIVDDSEALNGYNLNQILGFIPGFPDYSKAKHLIIELSTTEPNTWYEADITEPGYVYFYGNSSEQKANPELFMNINNMAVYCYRAGYLTEYIKSSSGFYPVLPGDKVRLYVQSGFKSDYSYVNFVPLRKINL